MRRFRIAAVIALLAIGIAWLALRDRGEPRAERSTADRGTVAELDDLAPEVLVPPPAPPPAAEVAPHSVAEYSPEDPVGIVVYGTVRAPDGTLVAESWIGARADERTFRRAPVTEGSFSLTGLRPGSWVITTDLRGVGKIERTVELAAREPFVRLDLVLEGSTLVYVRFVCPDGTSLIDRARELNLGLGWRIPLIAVATEHPPGLTLPLTVVNAHERYGLGEFRARGGPGRDIGIDKEYYGVLETATPPPYHASAVLRHVVIDTVAVAPGDREVVFTISVAQLLDHLCRVSARIVDGETGEPLAGAEVTVSTAQGGGGGAKADASGAVIVEGMLPGPLQIEVRSPDREFFDLWFMAIAPGTDLGEIVVDRATTVKGTVVDEAGNPVACSLTWIDVDRFESTRAEYYRYDKVTIQTETDGTFAYSTLGRGLYLFYPGRPFGRVPTLIDTRGGSVEGCTVRAIAGVDVKILTGAEPAAPLPIRVDDSGGFPIYAGQATRPLTLRLAPGRYSVRVDDGGRVRSATFTVGSEPLEVTVAP